MKIFATFTRGLLLGAGLMYLMDPSEGGRRRALVRDKGVRAWHRSRRVVAGALGAAVLAYGTSRALQGRQVSRDEGPLAPNYAYLR